jgi:adenine specific DNA methylase Mod
VFAPESRKKIGHPAPFPEELPYRLIKFYSYKGNIVLDMFAGSGTAGLVAKKLDRNFILVDNSMEYCELSAKRLEREFQSSLFHTHSSKIEIITYEELKEKLQKVSYAIVAEKRSRYATSREKYTKKVSGKNLKTRSSYKSFIDHKLI